MIIIELSEAQKSEPDDRKEYVNKFIGLCENIYMINMSNDHIKKQGKVIEDK